MNDPNHNGAPVTLRDVARTLGISHMTVSRALRHSPHVNEALRKRIHQVAEELGYRPNPAASALTHFRGASRAKPIQAVLAWLNFWHDPKKLRSNPLFDGNWLGAVEAAEALGYRVEEFICDRTLPPERLKRILIARGIHGVILPPQRPPIQKESFDFDWSRFSAIRIGSSVPYPPVHMVSYSQASDVVEALRNMREKGYERIGFVTSPAIQGYGLFDAGYMKSRANWPQKDQIPVLVLGDRTDPDAHVVKQLYEWMKKNKPEAILSTENIKFSLTAAGYRVPEDIGLAATSINYSDVDSGMFENPQEVGRVAVRNLIGLLHRSEFGVPEFRQDILVRSVWKDGVTLPNCR